MDSHIDEEYVLDAGRDIEAWENEDRFPSTLVLPIPALKVTVFNFNIENT